MILKNDIKFHFKLLLLHSHYFFMSEPVKFEPEPEELELLTIEENNIIQALPKNAKKVICEKIGDICRLCGDVMNEQMGIVRDNGLVRIAMNGIDAFDYDTEASNPIQGSLIKMNVYKCFMLYKALHEGMTKVYTQRLGIWKELKEVIDHERYDGP